LLVNNVFRDPPAPGGTSGLFGKFWEFGVDAWDAIHTVGCRSNYVPSCYAAPLIKKNYPRSMWSMARPMIAMISNFGFNVAFGVGMAAVDRLAEDMAVELRYEVIPVTSFYPGVVLTERTQRAVESGDWAREV
jgi:dehydrogenase/reductase SDR family protein 1